jgi:hypothetical protein
VFFGETGRGFSSRGTWSNTPKPFPTENPVKPPATPISPQLLHSTHKILFRNLAHLPHPICYPEVESKKKAQLAAAPFCFPVKFFEISNHR